MRVSPTRAPLLVSPHSTAHRCSTGTLSSPRWDSEIWAAVEIDTGSAIADPFRPSADLVELLRFRAERVRAAATGRRGRLASLLPRAA